MPSPTRHFGNSLLARRALAALLFAASVLPGHLAMAHSRVLEILADRDSRYKIAGQHTPEITLRVGETITLRITARKGKTWNRDGSIHGFTLLNAHTRVPVPGWDLLLKPGTQDFSLTAPLQPGEYEVTCTVICTEDHEGMRMKIEVVP